MTTEKRQQIKDILSLNWDKHIDKADLCTEVANGFIFGPHGHSEHYAISELLEICKEIETEKNIENAENTTDTGIDPGGPFGTDEGI